jgi:hypothetical protein
LSLFVDLAQCNLVRQINIKLNTKIISIRSDIRKNVFIMFDQFGLRGVDF